MAKNKQTENPPKTKEATGKKEETSDTKKLSPRHMAAQPGYGVRGEGGPGLVWSRAHIFPVFGSPL